MSDMGLNASIYEQLRVYADRIDCDLIKLQSSDKKAADAARKDLVELLREIGTTRTDKPAPRLVALVLREELPGKFGNFERIFQNLAEVVEKNRAEKDDFKRLDDIASAIDKECLNASARMQGRA